MRNFKSFLALSAVACWASPAVRAQQADEPQLLSGTYVTPAATAQAARICPSGKFYPQEDGWMSRLIKAPVSATKGAPRIDQLRNGQVIATYRSFSDRPGCTLAGDGTDNINPAAPAASGCGPFTRDHTWRLWQPGDIFNVYPAVYSGPYNQPWFGPEYDDGADYAAGISHTPDNIVVRGIVKGGVRPVILLLAPASDNTLGQAPMYFDVSNGMTIDSINIVAGPHGEAGKAGIYDDGASNLTLSNLRISGFQRSGVNGLFGAGNYSGTLTLNSVELDHNGGQSGPAHNAYIGASLVDPTFTVVMSHSWSHDAYIGHLFKSRAQNGVFTANFFQGGTPQRGKTVAETYLLDIPNGGQVNVRNNIFVKNASGPSANGMSLTFLMEGTTDARPQSLDVENNSFVTFAKTFDGSHPNYPLSLLYPNVRPDSAAWPANIGTRIIKNGFVGYCTPDDGEPMDYRGDISLIEGFSELTGAYRFQTKIGSSDNALRAIYPNYVPELGTQMNSPVYDATPVRLRATIGAKD